MIMYLLYGGDNFRKAMNITNTCGWDTDCNSDNVACLVGLMHGLAGFEGGPDWLGLLADRAIISSADGGYSINNAARIAYDIAKNGHRLSGQPEIPLPKEGAQFHLSLPGSVQGFQVTASSHLAHISQGQDRGVDSLGIHINGLTDTSQSIEVMTATFTPRELLESNTAGAEVRIRLKAYNEDDGLVAVDSHPIILEAAQESVIEWTIPESLENWLIQPIEVAIHTSRPSSILDGSVFLHCLGWDGAPQMTRKRPAKKSQSFWSRSWVSSVDKVHTHMGPSFFIAQDLGEGILSQGTPDWAGYDAPVSEFTVNHGGPMGVAARVQGLNRYYALMLTKDKRTVLVKAEDEKRIELARAPFDWKYDLKYDVRLTVQGSKITGQASGIELAAEENGYLGCAVAMVVTDRSLSADSITVSPVEM